MPKDLAPKVPKEGITHILTALGRASQHLGLTAIPMEVASGGLHKLGRQQVLVENALAWESQA